ncbi:hypothetical protein M3P36_04125 [Altererythrobacter sp. KTW20L]|uniref:hypothetical protein n=1 Tax=Altererythrobacter sp. KTW20L TaxID=2942210 RepID=UPI0020BE8318|nr:hypothetical protein [Altererythrobacter sp. KTW20L]MCL6250236.1 hypothetical protein [Altererythrobacter sp. KTW20L]
MRDVPLPLLTLEEFFDGNDFVGSIGCNLESIPRPADFYNWLTHVRNKPEVSDVRIQITCVDDPGNDWPFSDTIWVITSESASSVKEWVPEKLGPCETWEGWSERTKYDECHVAEGHTPIAVWYD